MKTRTLIARAIVLIVIITFYRLHSMQSSTKNDDHSKDSFSLKILKRFEEKMSQTIAVNDISDDCGTETFYCPSGVQFEMNVCSTNYWSLSGSYSLCDHLCDDVWLTAETDCTHSCGNQYLNHTNGCGERDLFGLPHWSTSFTSACNIHDICYVTKGLSKRSCDDQFLNNMYSMCSAENEGQNCQFNAALFYHIVAKFGNDAYLKAQKWAQDKCRKTVIIADGVADDLHRKTESHLYKLFDEWSNYSDIFITNTAMFSDIIKKYELNEKYIKE